MSEKLKEEIKFNTEWIRLLVVGLIAITGGLISIQFSAEIKYRQQSLLLTSGIIFTFVIIVILGVLNVRNIKKLKKL
jgi:hypothetical protein